MNNLWALVPVVILVAIGLVIFVDFYNQALKEQGEKNARIRKSESELARQGAKQ